MLNVIYTDTTWVHDIHTAASFRFDEGKQKQGNLTIETK